MTKQINPSIVYTSIQIVFDKSESILEHINNPTIDAIHANTIELVIMNKITFNGVDPVIL
jgi:hypothetical protein